MGIAPVKIEQLMSKTYLYCQYSVYHQENDREHWIPCIAKQREVLTVMVS
ncbi:hypothetical protein [Nitrosospira sp. NpAV]|nr:hypothetical protein [Nitrosospira sp. NpAV]